MVKQTCISATMAYNSMPKMIICQQETRATTRIDLVMAIFSKESLVMGWCENQVGRKLLAYYYYKDRKSVMSAYKCILRAHVCHEYVNDVHKVCQFKII